MKQKSSKNRKPMTTKQVAPGLRKILERDIPMSLANNKEVQRALRWMTEWADYLESDEFLALSKERSTLCASYKKNETQEK